MIEVMEGMLEAKKRELERQKEYFQIYIKNIESPTYEDNAINILLGMKKLKTEIAQLEFYLSMQ